MDAAIKRGDWRVVDLLNTRHFHPGSGLQGMLHPDLIPSAAVPAEVAKEGDAWAQQTYINYFAGVPGLTEAPVVCGPKPDVSDP